MNFNLYNSEYKTIFQIYMKHKNLYFELYILKYKIKHNSEI